MIVVVMGVSGAGKTAVAGELAKLLGAGFLEGDDFHPPANIVKMRSAIPLDDEDRRPWLRKLAGAMEAWAAGGRDVVVACSALKYSYRQLLKGDHDDFRLIYLKGSRDMIAKRLEQRDGHFMPPGLLESQFAELEEPIEASEDVITVSMEQTPAAMAAEIQRRLDRRE